MAPHVAFAVHNGEGADFVLDHLACRLEDGGAVRYRPEMSPLLTAACRCSQARVEGMLRSFPEDDRAGMVEADGKIRVVCEYCSTSYEIAPESV